MVDVAALCYPVNNLAKQFNFPSDTSSLSPVKSPSTTTKQASILFVPYHLACPLNLQRSFARRLGLVGPYKMGRCWLLAARYIYVIASLLWP